MNSETEKFHLPPITMAMVVGFHAPVRKSELCLERRYMVRTNVIVFSTASIGPNVSPR